MNILNKVAKFFGYQKKNVGLTQEDSRFFRSLRSYLNSIDNMEINDPYKNSVWVFASINAIAQNISRVPFYIYTEKKKDIKNIVTSGPLYELFMNPNPYMITNTLFFATILFLELYGEAFWVMERDNVAEVPKELYVVNPSKFEPIIDREGEISVFRGYWEYQAGSKKIEFPPHQILQFKYFNPYNELRGSSGYEPSKIGVEQDYFANKYNKQFFKDGISLSGIIKAPDFLTDEQFERLKSQFVERHGGYSNAHKVGIIEGGADFIETKTMSQRDMEFSILKNTIRGEILAAFKTNEVVLGNYSNIQCFHPDIEVLTNKGFISVKDVKINDYLATMNVDGVAEFKPVTNTYIYDYKGDMYKQKRTNSEGKNIGSYVDYLVTPEHKMFGKERKIKQNAGKYKTDNFTFKKVSEIDNTIDFCSPRTAKWEGNLVEIFDIGKRIYERKDYKNGSKQGYKDTIFPIKSFLKFLGRFISEGCFKSDDTFELSITQVKEEEIKQLVFDLKDFPYVVNNYRKEYVVSGKDLYNYLLDNVGRYSYERRIPREILDLHPSLLIYLFEALMVGDGTKLRDGYIYSTTSLGLANDVYELAIKLGYAPNLLGGKTGVKRDKGVYHNAKPLWRVVIPSKKSSDIMAVIRPEKEYYEGKVYCFEVPPYHNVMIRYNGKVMWIGQSYEGIKNAHEAFWKETLLPKIIYLEEFLWSKFFSKMYGGKYWGGFDLSVVEALREDFSKKVEMAKVLADIGYPINMINKRLDMGFEEVPWGNMWYVKMGTVPVSSLENIPDDDISIPDEDPGTNPNKPEPEDTPIEPGEGKDINLTNRDDSLWKNYIARQIPVENLFKTKLKRYLFEQRKRVLEGLFKNKENIFVVEEEEKLLKNIFTNLYRVASRTGFELMSEELIIDESMYVEDFNDRLNFSVTTIINTINNSISTILNTEDTNQNKALKIRQLYNKIDNRVNTIARTESCAVINNVRYSIMKKSGIKYHKWISRSEKGRHYHLNNKIVKIGESFSKDFILRYPLDIKAPINETINCKCFTIPVIKIKEL